MKAKKQESGESKMALKDFLKKTADTAAKKAQEAVGNAAGLIREQLPMITAVYEKERDERRKKLEDYRREAFSCEKGSCKKSFRRILYTCPEDCACERKDAAEELHPLSLLRPEYLAYAEWMESNLRSYTRILEAAAEDIDWDAILDKANALAHDLHFPHGNKLPAKFISGAVPVNGFEEVAMAFIENELPDYCDSMYHLVMECGLAISLLNVGLGKNNQLLQFLIRAHECKLDIKRCPKQFLRQLSLSLPLNAVEIALKIDTVEIFADVTRDIYYDPTFYDIPEADFSGTAILLESTLDQALFEAAHPDIPYDHDKLLSFFVDEDGNFRLKKEELDALLKAGK